MDSPRNPKISVVMAVKDGRKYLRQAMDSVLGQTYGDFEFIIIDDKSTDGTLPIIGRYDDPRIRLMQNQSHLGLARSLNSGLNAARGEYIARMDADDVCLPERFEKQVRFLDQHADVAVLGTGIRLIDERGEIIRDVQMPMDSALVKWKLCFMNPIAHPSVMMRRMAIAAIGGYDPELTCSQDYDLWWRLSLKHQLANLPDILMLLRQHAGQVTSVSRSEQFEFGLGINQKHLSLLLGRAISKEMIRKLWTNEPRTAATALMSSRLLLDFFHKTSKGIQARRVKHSLAHDATSRIQAMIGPFLANPKAWPFVWRTFFMNPLSTLRFLRKRSRDENAVLRRSS